MKITEHINSAKNRTLFSFEILPPLKGQNIKSIYENIDPLMEFKPPFIDVTYHREEYVYSEKENGLLEKKIVRKRPGTVGICAAIQSKYGVDAVPHILCGGFSKEDTENFLIDLDFLGINNVMALRGDAVKSETYFTPEANGNCFASDLVTQIDDMNKGKYLDEVIEKGHNTNFCTGVAGYPEKHMEAPSLDRDIERLKQKIEAGAEYVVTQMFFDNQAYFEFVDKCRKNGINVPIIPGLKPIATKRQLSIIPHRFHVDMPDSLIREVDKCKDNKEVRQVGVEWCIQQSRELVSAGVPVLHYYSMGRSTNIQKIAAAVF
ncbi:methylenetetrahydrofolate reductase [NAD(P)H] [Christiangramia salexigens]|uniref:Methylenetetrahydrofolate reductase n=1 Tax=Christiangramia salexigens TaxID=1913577 RepID=A0A1L3J599_9FLAO|nr:methylenetetrahydrofolate reductase [NAD(P)H] [Christiangramia salexigens]APG60274.1 methylenetetrahydrofolate reductase [NAD(P)H] [Christiangramia salexigens]